MNTPPIVSLQEWQSARERLLVKEKALTRARDALAAERRRMPWLAVDKEYGFEGPEGAVSLVTAKLTDDARRFHRLSMTDDLTGLRSVGEKTAIKIIEAAKEVLAKSGTEKPEASAETVSQEVTEEESPEAEAAMEAQAEQQPTD